MPGRKLRIGFRGLQLPRFYQKWLKRLERVGSKQKLQRLNFYNLIGFQKLTIVLLIGFRVLESAAVKFDSVVLPRLHLLVFIKMIVTFCKAQHSSCNENEFVVYLSIDLFDTLVHLTSTGQEIFLSKMIEYIMPNRALQVFTDFNAKNYIKFKISSPLFCYKHEYFSQDTQDTF